MPDAPKKFSINEWYDSLTEEQKKAHTEKIHARKREIREQREQERANAILKAQAMLPELIAKEILAGDQTKDYQPSNDVLHKLRALIDRGMGIDEMRQGPFRALSNKSWENLKKYLFKDHYSQIEDLGLDLIKSKKQAIANVKKRIRTIKKEIRLVKSGDKKKPIPIALLQLLSIEENHLHSIETDIAKNLHGINAVGTKASTGGLTVILNTPRPPKQVIEGVVEVVPNLTKLVEAKKA